MRAEDWCALALRVVGVVAFLYGMAYLLESLLSRLGYSNYPEPSPSYYVIFGIAYCVVGAYLVRGAPLIVGYAYPIAEDDDEEIEVEKENR